ncbi:MAG: hypothetical protein Q9186_002650 [Xanthomendoza sp. 1 TL-2023]
MAAQGVLAQNDSIILNSPLDPDSQDNFNHLDRLNVSVRPYGQRIAPKVHLACLSNSTEADDALTGGDVATSEPVQQFWDVIPLKRIPGNGLDNCQITWADGDLTGKSRNFSINHNDTAKPRNWGFQPQFFAPEQNSGHRFTYPSVPSGRYITVNANDNVTVSWTQGGSAQATVLGVECWSRSADPFIQSRGEPAISGPVITINATEFTVPMAKYINYSSCAFTLQNSIPDNYTEISDHFYISNATTQVGQTWTMEHQAPTNLTVSSQQQASGAGMIGGSAVALLVGVFVSMYLLAA